MRIGSLFSGYGGLDMAVQAVLGGTVAWYSEIEPAACRVLEAHLPGVPNIGDVTAVDWTTVESVDVLTGGYPCQPFSHAGKRKGRNDERHLWPYVCAAIDALRPGLVVLENVRGHLTLGFGDVIADLSRVGYDARWGVVRAADARAPHQRARIFIAAMPSNSSVAGTRGHIRAQGLQVQPRGSIGISAYPYSRSFSRTPVVNDGLPISAERDSDAAADTDRDGHGSELHARGMAGVEGQAEGSSRERQRPRREPDAGGIDTAAAADRSSSGEKSERTQAPMGGRRPRQSWAEPRRPALESRCVDWGKYDSAIHRWEYVLGRVAPAPTVLGRNERARLNPQFVEWMMGLPDGHVTGHGLSAAQELKMLGNGVVPQQAALALRLLGVAA